MFEVDDHLYTVSSAVLLKPLTAKQIDQIITRVIAIQQTKNTNLTLLLLDKDAIAGPLHLKACIHFALRAFVQQTNIAKKVDAEIMLYIAGVRQIAKAIPKVGLSKGTKELLFVQLFKKDATNGKRGFSVTTLDFREFLSQLKIPFEDHHADIAVFYPNDYSRITHNLQLSDDLIGLFSSQEKQERAMIIERLAIERSTLLELQK